MVLLWFPFSSTFNGTKKNMGNLLMFIVYVWMYATSSCWWFILLRKSVTEENFGFFCSPLVSTIKTFRRDSKQKPFTRINRSNIFFKDVEALRATFYCLVSLFRIIILFTEHFILRIECKYLCVKFNRRWRWPMDIVWKEYDDYCGESSISN